jgi:hypothetical protein
MVVVSSSPRKLSPQFSLTLPSRPTLHVSFIKTHFCGVNISVSNTEGILHNTESHVSVVRKYNSTPPYYCCWLAAMTQWSRVAGMCTSILIKSMTGKWIILEKIIIGTHERGRAKGREWQVGQVAYHLVGYFRFFCNRGLQNSIATGPLNPVGGTNWWYLYELLMSVSFLYMDS